MSPWPQVATQVKQISMAPEAEWSGPRTPTRPQVSAQTISMAFDGIRSHGHQNTDPGSGRTTDPDVTLNSSLGPDVTMAPCGRAGCSDLYGPRLQHDP
ncbi:hypothetical protein STEG23_034881 [Scotinomys teguina]